MGISERKEREKQEMRERILQAAAIVFVDKGYEGTSIRSIADRIEYSPATIYLYFKDKDELLFAVQEVAFTMLMKRFHLATTIADPLHRLYAIGASYLEFALQNPEYYDLCFVLTAPMRVIEHAKKWEMGKASYCILHDTVQACLEMGYIRGTDARQVAVLLWSLIHGLVTLYLRNRLQVLEMEPTALQQLISESLDQIMTMLKT